MAGPSQAADPGTFRLLTLNTWVDRFKPDATQISNFLINGNYDVLTFQELRDNSTYLAQIPGVLDGAGLGTYGSTQIGDVGVLSRLPGTYGTQTLPGVTSQGRYVSYLTAGGDAGRPETVIGTVHLDYADLSDSRINEAKALNDWAKGIAGPLIITGDFNAGDISERGPAPRRAAGLPIRAHHHRQRQLRPVEEPRQRIYAEGPARPNSKPTSTA